MPAYQSVKPFSFTIDDTPYMLEGVTLEKIEEFGGVGDLPEAEQMKFVQKLIEKYGDKRTAEAIRTKLSVGDLQQLFQDWMGAAPGESQSLPESTENTDKL